MTARPRGGMHAKSRLGALVSSRSKKKLLRRMSQSDSRRHHYVPAGYIGFFAQPRGRNGRLYVWDNQRRKSWIATPNKVAWVEDLYRLKPGDPPHAAEEGLADVEKILIRAIAEIDAKPRSPPTLEQVSAITTFVALQFVRGPGLLEEFDRVSSKVLDNLLKVVTATPERYEAEIRRIMADKPEVKREELPTYEKFRASLKAGGLAFNLDHSFLVTSVLRTQEAVFNVLADMRPVFHWIEEGEELVTANHPILLIPPRGLPPTIPVGVATALAVMMPLTPNVLFTALPEGNPNEITASPAPADLATRVNRLLAYQSQQVYSRNRFTFDPSQPSPEIGVQFK